MLNIVSSPMTCLEFSILQNLNKGYFPTVLRYLSFKCSMKKSFVIKRFIFYLWIGLAYLLLWAWHDLSTFEATLLQALLNNVWRTIYIIAVNFVFFEYVLSFVVRKRRYIIFNIFFGIVLLFVFMIIWSYGLYTWRALGVGLNIYTPLGETGLAKRLLASQMAF